MTPSTIARINGNRYFCIVEHDVLSPVGYYHYHSPYRFKSPSEACGYNAFASVQQLMDTVLKDELPPRTTKITIYKAIARLEGDMEIEDYEPVLVCEGGFNEK